MLPSKQAIDSLRNTQKADHERINALFDDKDESDEEMIHPKKSRQLWSAFGSPGKTDFLTYAL